MPKYRVSHFARRFVMSAIHFHSIKIARDPTPVFLAGDRDVVAVCHCRFNENFHP
jgi:hypothetical protein